LLPTGEKRQKAGPEEAAGKKQNNGENPKAVPQGLKPDIDLIGLIGTTEVVP